jgi:hypothetical protein
MTRRLLKFSQLMEAPYLMANYDKEAHQMGDDDWKSRHVPDPEYKSMGTMKSGHEVVRTSHSERSGYASYSAVDHTHKVHIKVDGQHREDGTFRVTNLTGHKKSEVKAHDFYHHLLDHFNIQSDNTHSKGGAATWQKLSKMPDVKMKHTNSGNYNADTKAKKIKLDKRNWMNNYHVAKIGHDSKERILDKSNPETKELSHSRFTATKKK